MINNTFDLLWRDISPFTIGFDRTFDTLSLLANSKQQASNYPPYNIRKVSEDKYTIELAVAGFEENEIDIIDKITRLVSHPNSLFIHIVGKTTAN